MTDGNAAVSGSTAYAPPSGHQAFLYMASRYNPGVSRDRVGTDGSVSFSYDPSAPGSGAPTPAPALGAGPDALVATPDGHYLHTNGSFLLAPDGTVSELPLPAFRPLSPRVGNNNAIALSPSGKFAFVGVSTDNSSGGFDRVVPMGVEADGTLTPIAGAAKTLQAPPLPSPSFRPVYQVTSSLPSHPWC